jgi:hypothetical protein
MILSFLVPFLLDGRCYCVGGCQENEGDSYFFIVIGYGKKNIYTTGNDYFSKNLCLILVSCCF